MGKIDERRVDRSVFSASAGRCEELRRAIRISGCVIGLPAIQTIGGEGMSKAA
jgi:hypothetical protein